MTHAISVVATGAAADAIAESLPRLVEHRFASRLFAQDPTLWGADAESEASVRLSWVGLWQTSRPLLGQIRALKAELDELGIDHIVLCGMGGSSLAPEVICAATGSPLTVLDSSDPDQVRSALTDRIAGTAVVISSKSGSTVETDSQKRAYEAAFTEAGIDPAERIVIVTDPGSPLDQASREAGYRVVNADPQVGGRYSALTAFGLVPSGLAGVNVEALLDQAGEVADLLAFDDDANPGLLLGTAMAGTTPLRDKLILVPDGSPLPGFADWAEQLIAESTGKLGTGLLPVVVTGADAPELGFGAADLTTIRLRDDSEEPAPPLTDSEIQVSGSLGAQLLLWEVATAVAGRLLDINPFDQPDVESAKAAARALLETTVDPEPPLLVDGPIEVRVEGDFLPADTTNVRAALDGLLGTLRPEVGYLAVMAYLDRLTAADLAECRSALASRTQRPVTFGWGPRFLHSTGQLHKGGPPTGVYLQITAAPAEDLPIPGRPFTFGQFIASQAAGDAQVLSEHGRPVLRLHLVDQRAGLAMLRDLLG